MRLSDLVRRANRLRESIRRRQRRLAILERKIEREGKGREKRAKMRSMWW